MKKVLLVISAVLLSTSAIFAQTQIKGVVKVADSETPLPGVTITLLQQNISTKTIGSGEFLLTYLTAGVEEVSISKPGYLPQIKEVVLKENETLDLGTIFLKMDLQEEMRQDAVLQLNESDFSEDEGRATQSISSSISRGDVYVSQTSFSFSPMRFRLRGYEQEYESTYINGVHFNSLDRGGFNYSSLGGLNDAMRNKDVVVGLDANSFSYGNLGSNTNIVNRASAFAAGTKASVAYSNRAYKLRGQVTYATGVLPSGWAFTVSGLFRWADEGIADGTFYNSAGYFLAAEKIFNPRHSLSLVTYGAPTQRAQQSATTQEVYDLTGSIYYNSYWGYQDGKKRNSRVVKSYDPTAILSHDFKISQNQRLRTGLAFHYSLYSNSAVGFYNAPDPRPDYYRNLPSFLTDSANTGLRNEIAEQWKFENGKPVNPSVSQLNWDAMYQANYRNNAVNPDGSARYSVERRHSNLMESVFNSTYTNQMNRNLKLTAGLEAKYAKDMNFKTMEDLLGGKQWIDIDQFAERDYPSNPDIIQNDINNPNRAIRVGDVFGYKYDINIYHASAFLQNEWNWSKLDLYYAAKLTYSQFSRYGYMKNGRAPENSYGQGKVWWFVDPSFKAGATYKLNGRNRLYANVLAETRAPLPSGAYVSERIKDTRVPNLESRKILSYDLNYSFLFPSVRGRLTGFRTYMLGTTENLGYYDDELRTFINHMLTKSDKIYQGIEAGVSVKLNRSFSVSTAGTFADYRYTNNAIGIKSYENGVKPDFSEVVLTKDLKINSGPQLAANITLDYFHPKMWFADITLNYFDNNYLDFAPNRFTESNMARYTTEEAKAALGSQEKLKGGFLLDASIGKLIYLKNKKSINFNLSCSNILNNTSMITGGYQQARLPLVDNVLDMANLNKFPNKYYYAWGFNLFLNIGYKF
ncbi:MAG TPA: carboxypeptidase-like regulatory domain-containing protein [Paludibacteraceae bacterium]|nr:carboxypeptidase-like regulatory domain-containing protein [Paludibacteraceae bacterium]HPT42445.1 carboxypeptidase-like regulatory domain-containing protein [Paludibacteraceae bacterium]